MAVTTTYITCVYVQCSIASATPFNRFYTLDYVLDCIDGSKNEFETLAGENPESEEYVFLQAASAATWLKTEDYYRKADQSAAYYAASVLDPAFKWSWFEDCWRKDEVKKFWLEGHPAKNEIGVKGLVQELWEEESVILLDWRTIGLDLVGLDSVVSLLWIGLDRLVWRLLELQ